MGDSAQVRKLLAEAFQEKGRNYPTVPVLANTIFEI